MMKTGGYAAVVALFLSFGSATNADSDFELQDFKVDRSVKLPLAPVAARGRWKDERFGMFVHWGPISQMGQPLSHSRNSPSHRPGGRPYKIASIPPEIYDIQYKTFNPVKFDPDAMAKMAKNAGVAYLVFTTKHTAGFSMFDSAFTDYDIMSAPYKKDIAKMIADACRANDVRFGFYYAPRDWHHPDCDSGRHHDRYIRFFLSQMHELLTGYGPIHEVWFDGLGPGKWGDTSRVVMNMIRKLHPEAMVNDRGGAGADFYTPEHTISYFNRDECWEACHTTTSQWGYNPKVHAKPLSQLMEILLYTWGSDGNILLNIGPTGDGALNPEEVERFGQIADWWKTRGETAIRGSRGGPYIPGPWGAATCKDKRVFLHVFRWPESGGLFFPGLKGLEPKSARLLAGGTAKLVRRDGGFEIQVPESEREPIATTVEVRFDGETRPVEPLYRVEPLTASAKLSASSNPEALKNLTDHDARTSWQGRLAEGESGMWVRADWETPATIGCFGVAYGHRGGGSRCKAELQVPDGSGGWKTVSGKPRKLKYETMMFLPEPVTASSVRLRMDGVQRFGFAEFELFPPVSKPDSK